MKYEVFVSKKAKELLLLHVKFLSQVSVPAAKILRKEFSSVVEKLSSNPYQFQEEIDLNLPKGKYRRAVFLKRYKVVFFVSGSEVHIDAIIDCRQSVDTIQI
jgi:plasmid stabilization system protein ParE